MPLSDTTTAAARVQLDLLRRMLPARRLELAVDMSLTARALLAARLRAEHPDWTAPRVQREVLHLSLMEPARRSRPA